MNGYITILCIAKFIENEPELTKEINKLPFKGWHNTFIMLLQKCPLPLGKKKAILKNKNPKVTFGILTDHFMGLARKFGIPRVYIKGLATERWLVRRRDNTYVDFEDTEVIKCKKELTSKTLDLVIALSEKIREHKNSLINSG